MLTSTGYVVEYSAAMSASCESANAQGINCESPAIDVDQSTRTGKH